MHVLGSTGSGKSKFLTSLIRQDILAGNGLCLLDPHGSIYTELAEWLSNRPMLSMRRKVRLIDLTSEKIAFGFNPLKADNPRHIPRIIEGIVQGITVVYGGSDINDTPLISATMDTTCTLLLHNNQTLLESEYILHYEEKTIRQNFAKRLHNKQYKRILNTLDSRKLSEFNDEVASTERRFRKFLNTPGVRQIFGQNKDTIDLKKCMDDGEILLINLGSSEQSDLTLENQRLVGMFLINNLIARCYERPLKPKPRPFHVYMDEAQRFITDNIAEILAETRKFGLHVTLAHQNLEQLRDVSDKVFRGVMSEARTKVIFGDISMEDATYMAKETLYNFVSPDKVKEVLSKPVVVGYETVRMKNESVNTNESSTSNKSSTETKAYGEGQSEVEATAYGTTFNESTAMGEGLGEVSSSSFAEVSVPDASAMFLAEGEDIISMVSSNAMSDITNSFSSSSFGTSSNSSESKAYGSFTSTANSIAQGSGSAKTLGTGYSSGWSETLMPILKVLPSATYSLEEQYHELAKALKNQPTRFATVKTPGGSVFRLKALDVPDETVSEIRMKKLLDENYRRTPFLKDTQKVLGQIEARQKYLEAIPTVQELENDDFYE